MALSDLLPNLRELDLTQPGPMALALAPEVFLTAGALVVLLVIAWRHDTAADVRRAGWLSVGALLLTGVVLGGMGLLGASASGMPQMITLDAFRWAGGGIVLLAAVASTVLSI